jgi:hypothetical protein
MAYEGLATVGACTKGDLPERNQYDIHCPLMGGPDYKLNYVSAGCLERQLYNGCSANGCKHLKTNIVKKKSIEPQARVYTLGEFVHGKRAAACAECGIVRPIVGRGCCGGCMMRLRKLGTLDALHPQKKGGRKKKTTEGSKSNRLADPVSAEEKPETKQARLGVAEPAQKGTTPDLVVTAGETAQPLEVNVGTNKTIAVCVQCDRKMTLIARGLCGKCYNAHRKAGTLDEKYPAKRVVKVTNAQPEYSPDSVAFVREVTPAVAGVGGPQIRLTVIFKSEKDTALADQLQEWADDERRTVEAQILWVLDQHVTNRINGRQV